MENPETQELSLEGHYQFEAVKAGAERWINAPLQDPLAQGTRRSFALAINRGIQINLYGSGSKAIEALLEAIDLKLQRALDTSNSSTPSK